MSYRISSCIVLKCENWMSNKRKKFDQKYSSFSNLMNRLLRINSVNYHVND
jgi:hypothetical protein